MCILIIVADVVILEIIKFRCFCLKYSIFCHQHFSIQLKNWIICLNLITLDSHEIRITFFRGNPLPSTHPEQGPEIYTAN